MIEFFHVCEFAIFQELCGKTRNLKAIHTLNSQKDSKHQENVFLVSKHRHPHHLSLQLDLKMPRLEKFFPMKVYIYNPMQNLPVLIVDILVLSQYFHVSFCLVC